MPSLPSRLPRTGRGRASSVTSQGSVYEALAHEAVSVADLTAEERLEMAPTGRRRSMAILMQPLTEGAKDTSHDRLVNPSLFQTLAPVGIIAGVCMLAGVVLLATTGGFSGNTPEPIELTPKFLQELTFEDPSTLASAEEVRTKMIHRLYLTKDRDTSFESGRMMHGYLHHNVDNTDSYLGKMHEEMTAKLHRNLVTSCIARRTYTEFKPDDVAYDCQRMNVLGDLELIHTANLASGFGGLAYMKNGKGKQQDELYLAFRGSKNMNNFIADIGLAGLEARWMEAGNSWSDDWNSLLKTVTVDFLDSDDHSQSYNSYWRIPYVDTMTSNTLWRWGEMLVQYTTGYQMASLFSNSVAEYSNYYFQTYLMQHFVDAEKFIKEARQIFDAKKTAGVTDAGKRPPKIIFTGHSLGGCFAQVLGFTQLVTEASKDLSRMHEIRAETYNAPGCLSAMVFLAQEGKGKMSEAFRTAVTVHPAYWLMAQSDNMRQNIIDAFTSHKDTDAVQDYLWPKLRDSMENNFVDVVHHKDGVSMAGVHVCPTCRMSLEMDDSVTLALAKDTGHTATEEWASEVGMKEVGKALVDAGVAERVTIYHSIAAFPAMFAAYHSDATPSKVFSSPPVATTLADVASRLSVGQNDVSLWLTSQVEKEAIVVPGYEVVRKHAVSGQGADCGADLVYKTSVEECEVACSKCTSCAGFVDNVHANPKKCVFKKNVKTSRKEKKKDLYIRPALYVAGGDESMLQLVEDTFECLQTRQDMSCGDKKGKVEKAVEEDKGILDTMTGYISTVTLGMFSFM